MKYASKYYPFSFVRVASPHPRTHTDARHLRLISVSVWHTGVVGQHVWFRLYRAADTVATASNLWPLRVDSHAPSSAGGVRRRESWTRWGRGALARRDRGQTLSDIGRERAAGRAPATTARTRALRYEINTIQHFQLQKHFLSNLFSILRHHL